MRPDFAEALGDLLARYADLPAEELISVMEIQLMGLREEQRFEETAASKEIA